MQLSIKYQNGEHRILNLNAAFFDNELNARNGSPEKRATDIAHQLGSKPYHILLSQGGRVIMDKKNPGYEPELSYTKNAVDEKDLKKQLRKQFKSEPFSLKLIVSEGEWKQIGSQRRLKRAA